MVKRDLIRNIILVLIVILVAVLLRIFLFSTFRVREGNANSYLKNGDVVTVATKRELLPNDFVVYKVKGKEYVGRIVAEPGQTVTYMDDVFYVNSKVKQEDYLKSEKDKFQKTAEPGRAFTDDFTTETIAKDDSVHKIPKDSYLILNDNRQNKEDSRKFGFVSAKNIKGVISFRLWPLNKFGFVTVE